MNIELIAIWTRDLERMKAFYSTPFAAQANQKYVSARRGFESYFLTFASGARIEIMRLPELADACAHDPRVGLAHLAISLGSREAVSTLTERLRAEGYRIASEPRVTGDGYYESGVLDPDGNLIELTV